MAMCCPWVDTGVYKAGLGPFHLLDASTRRTLIVRPYPPQQQAVTTMRLLEATVSPLSAVVALLASAATVSAQVCDLPSSYRWTSTGPLAEPKAGWEALEDFTVTSYDGKQLVYATTHDRVWGTMAFSPVSSLTQLDSATQTAMDSIAVAPALFYFAPKSVWVLVHQWGPTTFSYRTTGDPTKVNGWSAPQPLFTGSITESGTGPLDPAIIGDSENMYLFFCGDNGRIYRASMPIGDFPGSFGSASTVVMSDRRESLWESVHVYTLKGQQKYLMTVEAFGPRGSYLRSFTATDLGGSWTPNAATLENAFASKNNSGSTWTYDISHGELVRDNNDQTFAIDPCKPLQLLYQGRDPGPGEIFGIYKYRPALLTQVHLME